MSDHPNFPIGGALDEHPSPRVLSYFDRVMKTWNVPCGGCGEPRSTHYQGEVCGGIGAVIDAGKRGLPPPPWYSDYEEGGKLWKPPVAPSLPPTP